LGNVGCIADVVGAEVCQHQVPQVRKLVTVWRIASASSGAKPGSRH